MWNSRCIFHGKTVIIEKVILREKKDLAVSAGAYVLRRAKQERII